MAKKHECRSCKFLDKRGRDSIRKGYAYFCSFEIPEQPALPSSVTKTYCFKWPPEKRFVQVDDGADCPVYMVRQ